MASSDDKHRGLWTEIRRRGVIHVAGLYVVTAWVIVQVADIVSQGPFPMPAEALRLIWIALIAIFPLVLVFGLRFAMRETRRFDATRGAREVDSLCRRQMLQPVSSPQRHCGLVERAVTRAVLRRCVRGFWRGHRSRNVSSPLRDHGRSRRPVASLLCGGRVE